MEYMNDTKSFFYLSTFISLPFYNNDVELFRDTDILTKHTQVMYKSNRVLPRKVNIRTYKL